MSILAIVLADHAVCEAVCHGSSSPPAIRRLIRLGICRHLLAYPGRSG
jgi:hypothetical protein